jgi:hypothetical protein
MPSKGLFPEKQEESLCSIARWCSRRLPPGRLEGPLKGYFLQGQEIHVAYVWLEFLLHGFDKFNVDCRQISNHESVQEWLRPGCWHILTYHGIGGVRDGWEPIPVKEFERHVTELAQYRDSGNARIVTFKGGAKQMAI